jgi:hypothetical protein
MDRQSNQPDERDSTNAGTGCSQPNQGTTGCAEPANETPVGENVGAQWQYRKRFAIQDRLVDVIKSTLDAARSELEVTRKKLEKAKYRRG